MCKRKQGNSIQRSWTGSDILTALAEKRFGTKYFPTFGIKVRVLSSSMKGGNLNSGILTVSISGIWFYQFSSSELEQIKLIAAGQPVDEVLKEIRKIPGVTETRINFVGFGNEYFLPKNAVYIRTLIVYRLT